MAQPYYLEQQCPLVSGHLVAALNDVAFGFHGIVDPLTEGCPEPRVIGLLQAVEIVLQHLDDPQRERAVIDVACEQITAWAWESWESPEVEEC